MGKANTAVNQWLKDHVRFASLYNGIVFGGRPVIKPEELEDLDRETDILITDKKGKHKGVQRYRDIVKRWRGEMDLAVLACESQSQIHYAMPVRNMLYDSLTYTDQIREVWRKHKDDGRKGTPKYLTAEEYLSQFRKDDKIYPVITLVFYNDAKRWDGALDLFGMFPGRIDEEARKALERYIPNYRINLVDAGHMDGSERFCTDLQRVFDMLKYRDRKEELQKYIYQNQEYFSSMDVETYQAVREFLHMEKELKEMAELGKEEKVNMCQAMEEWYQDALAEGREVGREEGRNAFLKELIERKLKKGLSVEEIAEILEADLETVRTLIEERN